MQFSAIKSSSSANLYTITSGETILLEAGLRGTALYRALSYNLSSIKACLITHYHGDHASGVETVIKAGKYCYMSQETADNLNIQGLLIYRIKIIEPLKQFNIDDWLILPFPTEHCPGSLGYLIEKDNEKLVFITDSCYCKYKFNGLTHICIECNWSEETLSPDIDPSVRNRVVQTHFSLEQVIRFLKSNDLSKLKEIHLLHLSDNNSHEGLFKKKIQEIVGVPVYIANK